MGVKVLLEVQNEEIQVGIFTPLSLFLFASIPMISSGIPLGILRTFCFTSAPLLLLAESRIGSTIDIRQTCNEELDLS